MCNTIIVLSSGYKAQKEARNLLLNALGSKYFHFMVLGVLASSSLGMLGPGIPKLLSPLLTQTTSANSPRKALEPRPSP